MPHAALDGINLYYEIHGDGDPLVLIAGYACRTDHWTANIEELARKYRVVIFDNRCVGQSDSPDLPCSIGLMARDACLLLDYLEIPSAHILGHSMGGCIAQHIAVNNPRYVKKLILSNALIKMNAVSALAQSSLLHLREDGTPMKRLIEAVLPWIFSNAYLSAPNVVETITELMLKNPYPQTLIGIKRQLEALLAFDSSGWFAKIHSPTLVIGGEEDILCPRDSEHLSQGIPGARFVNMPAAAHVPMIEKPAEFNRIVLDFIQHPSKEK